MTRVQVRAALAEYLRTFVAAVGWQRLAGAVLLILVCTLLESVGLLLLVPLLQLVGESPTGLGSQWLLKHGVHFGLAGVLTVFVVVALLRVVLSRTRDFVLLRMRMRFLDILRARTERAVAMARWPYLQALNHADLMHLLFDQLAKVNQGSQFLMQGLAGMGLALAGLAVSFMVAPAVTLLVCVPVMVLLVLVGGRLGTVVALGLRAGQAQRDLMSAARDFLAGLKLVKAHAAEADHLAEFSRRAERVSEQQLKFFVHQAMTRGAFEVGGACMLALLVYGASTWAGMALPELLLVVLVFARLMPVVREGHTQLQQVVHMLPAFQELKTAISSAEQAAEPTTDDDAIAWSGDVRFEAVGVRYGDAPGWALQGISFVLAQGSTSVLVGPSGAGKTTLVHVAMGLVQPQEGTVRVGQAALADERMARQWRRCVAYVPQDPYLFAGTVRDNLLWLNGGECDDALWDVLAQADAAEFVRALPRGLDHVLAERGAGLSGGERQRLCVARALLGQPRLLVLDEPTSQLDAESHCRVTAALARLNGRYTVLVVAHRLDELEQADQILVLDGGRLVQSGAWRDLAHAPGRLHRLLSAARVQAPVEQ